MVSATEGTPEREAPRLKGLALREISGLARKPRQIAEDVVRDKGRPLTKGGLELIEEWSGRHPDRTLYNRYKEIVSLVNHCFKEPCESVEKVWAFDSRELGRYRQNTLDKKTLSDRSLRDKLNGTIEEQYGQNGIAQHAQDQGREFCPVLCKITGYKTGSKTKDMFCIVEIPTDEVKVLSTVPNNINNRWRDWIGSPASRLESLLVSWISAVFVVGLVALLWWATYSRIDIHQEMRNKSLVISIKNGIWGAESYLVYIHPRGWQDTGIPVYKGDAFSVRVLGQVNIGFDTNAVGKNLELAQEVSNEVSRRKFIDSSFTADKLEDEWKDQEKTFTENFAWQWVGQKGVADQARENKVPRKVKEDDTLLINVPGFEQGGLVGYVANWDVNEREKVRGYKVEYILSLEESVIDIKKAKPGSRLYLAVNDSEKKEWQYDNLGAFIVVLTRN